MNACPDTLLTKFPAVYRAGVQTVQQAARTQPQAGGVMSDWFIKLVMVRITKEQQDSQIVEKQTPFVQQGVVQPYRGKLLQIMREGERHWKWSTIHSTPALLLDVDDLIVVNSVQYRVMTERDFSLFGYVKYHVIRDYSNQPALGT